jgi:uncharacterized protein
VQRVALVIGLLSGLLFGILEIDDPPLPTPMGAVADACYAVCRISLMICYVAVLLKLSHEDRWHRVLHRLALVGRMPLTNYLVQTLICTFLFYGWGLGWWNQVSPLGNIGLALVIFIAVQIPLSAWWLERHPLGPMEYLWRWLTYGRSGMRRDGANAVGNT